METAGSFERRFGFGSGGDFLSIKSAARFTACLVVVCGYSILSAAQEATALSVNSDPSPQTQQQTPSDQGQSQQPPAGQSPASQTTPGQSSSTQSSDQSSNQQTDDKSKNGQAAGQGGKVAGTSNDRLFLALPNFLTVQNGGNLPPMTAKQKFKVVALGAFDRVQYPWWGIISAINQADDAEPAYGQGWLAYAKRYGTTAADSTIENFMVGAIFPVMLHQDPRFYESGNGKFFRRTGYAISRIVVTKGDNGHKQFNCSEICGSAFSAAISTFSYHPKSTFIRTRDNPHLFIPSDRTLTNTASVWGTQVALDTITLVLKEFWPDLHRLTAKKHKSEAAPAPFAPQKTNP
jgi:hypothetical protein